MSEWKLTEHLLKPHGILITNCYLRDYYSHLIDVETEMQKS